MKDTKKKSQLKPPKVRTTRMEMESALDGVQGGLDTRELERMVTGTVPNRERRFCVRSAVVLIATSTPSSRPSLHGRAGRLTTGLSWSSIRPCRVVLVALHSDLVFGLRPMSRGSGLTSQG